MLGGTSNTYVACICGTALRSCNLSMTKVKCTYFESIETTFFYQTFFFLISLHSSAVVRICSHLSAKVCNYSDCPHLSESCPHQVCIVVGALSAFFCHCLQLSAFLPTVHNCPHLYAYLPHLSAYYEHSSEGRLKQKDSLYLLKVGKFYFSHASVALSKCSRTYVGIYPTYVYLLAQPFQGA